MLERYARLDNGKVRMLFYITNSNDRCNWITLKTDRLEEGILQLHELPWRMRLEFRNLTDDEIREIFDEFRIPEGVNVEPFSSDDDSKTETWFYITPATREAVKEFSNTFGRWFTEGYRACYHANLARDLESWLYEYAKFNEEKGEWEKM